MSNITATINDLGYLVHHIISLGPRPDSGDLELQAAWDAAWGALVERARELGLGA